jgi:head-tail adaptor
MPGIGPIRKGAGQRRHTVALQSATTTIDALGGTSQTWATYATVQAAIEPQPFVTGVDNAEVITLITIPYHATMAAEQRVVHGICSCGQTATTATTYKVLASIDTELKRRALTLHCAEVVV